MNRSARWAIAGLLLLMVGSPLATLFRHHLSLDVLASIRHDADRLTPQLISTLSLMLLVVALSVPAGASQAFAMRRPGVRGRRWLGAAVLAGLFVPLPVWAVSWQIILGEWLPPLALEPGEVAWRPWTLGLLPAAWIHAIAAWPWAIAIVWLALRTSNPALDDEASQTGGPRGVFRWVTMPKLAWAVLAAACFIGMQAGTEIAITDAMMVRTFAEEVYTQMVVRSTGLGGAIAATIPVWLGSALALALVARFGMKRFRAVGADLRLAPSREGDFSISNTLLAWSPIALYLGLPVGALFWKTASGGNFAGRMEKLIRTEWLTLLDSLAAALLAGAFTASLAWLACAAAGRSPRFRIALFVGGLLLIAVPGPLVGFAIKEATVEIVVAERSILQALEFDPEFPPLRSMLYDQPSPIPGIWSSCLRFFPLACALLAVAMQRIPKSLVETAEAEASNRSGPLRRVIAPLTARSFLIVAVATAALAFGEVSAGKLAQPPARGVAVLRLFDQMHYGAESSVAGFCLLQLVATWGILCVLVGLIPERTPRISPAEILHPEVRPCRASRTLRRRPPSENSCSPRPTPASSLSAS